MRSCTVVLAFLIAVCILAANLDSYRLQALSSTGCAAEPSTKLPPVAVPGVFQMPVVKYVFSLEKPSEGNLLGDGAAAYVARVDAHSLEWFVKNMTGGPRDWSKGPFYKGDTETYTWILRWIKEADQKKLKEAGGLPALLSKRNIFHREEVRHNSSGDISNARIWILDLDQSTLIYLCSDT